MSWPSLIKPNIINANSVLAKISNFVFGEADNYSYGQLAGPKRAKEVVETWKTRGYESFYTIGTLMKQSAIKTFGSDEEEY